MGVINLGIFNKRTTVDLAVMTLIAYVVLLPQFLDSGLPGGTDSLGFVARTVYLGKDLRWLSIWLPHGFGFTEQIHLLDFILIPINTLANDPSFTVKFLVFASFVAAGFTMYAYVFRLKRRHNAALIAAIVYLLNQWLFIQFTEGHVDIMFSYALAPLLFLLLDRALKEGDLKSCVSLALMLSVFATGFHLQVFFIYGSFLPLYFLLYVLFPGNDVGGRVNALKRLLKVSIVSASIAALLSAFFVLPFFLGARTPYLSASYGYPIEDPYQNVEAFLDRIGFYTLIFLVPLALATLISNRDRRTLFFFPAALIAAFIAKGPHPPFGEVFVWLYVNVPYMHVFRAVKRWFMMTMFSYAFFTGLFIVRLEDTIKNIPRIKGKLRARAVLSSLRIAFSTILVGIILVNAMLAGVQFINSTQTYSPPEQILVPLQWISRDPIDFRVAQVGPFGFGNGWIVLDLLGSGYHEISYDSYYLHDKPVIQEGGWDPLARDFFRFISTSGSWRKTDELMEMLGTFNVKYIVLPYYASQEWRETFSKQPMAESVLNYADSVILENKHWTPRIFTTSKHALVLGGREAMSSLFKVPSFRLSWQGMIYLDQNVDAIFDLLANSNVLIFSESDVVDLAMLLAGKEHVIPTGQFAFPSLDSWKYWIQSHDGIDYGKLVTSRLTLTTSGNNTVEMPFTAKENGDYEVWLRLGFSAERGKISIAVNNELVGSTRPEAKFYSKFDWVNLGAIYLEKGTHSVTLANDGTGHNNVDAFALVPSSLMQLKVKEASSLIQDFQGRVIIIYEAEDLFGQNPSLRGWTVDPLPFKASNGFVIGSSSLTANKAPQGQVSASSIQGVGFEPRMAVDGDVETRWASEFFELPQWLQIEWEQPQELWNVNVLFEKAYAEAYQVQTWDGSNWINQTIEENNTMLERQHFFDPPIETTKLRLYFTGASAYNSISIYEIEAYSASASAEIFIPRPQRYMFCARLATGPNYGKIKFELGNFSQTISCNNPNTSFRWYEIGTIPLDAGEQQINIASWMGNVSIDEVLLYSLHDGENIQLDDLFESNPPSAIANVTRYEQINPSQYNVQVESAEPFLLIFSDTYHPMWKAYVGDLEMAHVVAYSFVNGFFINKTGQFTITLCFTGQIYADLGLRISAVTLVMAVAILATPSKVFKRLRNYIRRRTRAQKSN